MAAEELEGLQHKIEPDAEDPDGQSLLFNHPSAFVEDGDDYVRRVVKIESGAKSALDPYNDKAEPIRPDQEKGPSTRFPGRRIARAFVRNVRRFDLLHSAPLSLFLVRAKGNERRLEILS
ncbi:hypothetical protein AAFG07_31505 [Bradyrhizobium sp. B097]|uniref:hypothetical protein n=1 Tax=Bradyrhizobium sp. B097 TaxID=3140244 RepID=UPI003183C1D9